MRLLLGAASTATLVCACLVLAAAAVGRADHHRRGPRRTGASSPTCSRPSSTRARCSAGSAPRGWSWPCTTCSTASPRRPSSQIREAMSGNLCRCTGYGRILAAVARPVADGAGGERRERHRPRRRPAARTGRPAGSATSAPRPDGGPKVQGSSPSPPTSGPTACCGAPPCARRTRTPASWPSTRRPAWTIPGVARGRSPPTTCPAPTYGLEHRDQPVFADEVVRYVGEPVAVVAADHPETARRAAGRDRRRRTRCSSPLIDPEAARRRQPPADPPRRQRPPPPADRAAATPTPPGAGRRRGHLRDRHAGPGVPRARRPGWPSPTTTAAASSCIIATQWLHDDRDQIAACLGLPEDKGAPDARRRRRRLRRPRGRQPAGPRLPAGAADRAAR